MNKLLLIAFSILLLFPVSQNAFAGTSCTLPEITCGGVCVNPNNDENNCGACGNACSSSNVAALSCTSGVCDSTCDSVFANCSLPNFPSADDGCETANTDTTCGSSCADCAATGGVCDAGICSSTCIPATVCPAGQECGTAPDGCGGSINCGTCGSSSTCGGGGIPGVCGVSVGGEIILIDSTSLIMAGTQLTAAWLIPFLVSVVGIGIAVFTLRKEQII